MNSTSYIAASLILALILLGVIVSWYNKKKKKKDNDKLRQEFNEFAIKNHLAIDKKQILNKNIIGIDRMNFKLIFLDRSTDPQQFHLIDLRDLSDCRLIKQRNNSNGHISHIFLQCIFNDKNKSNISLPFYNEINDDLFQMLRLSKKASYWVKSINLFKESAVLLMQNA